ncbi:hypothetical protein IFR05_002275 [Cadophora sp. M221]|nr:hypothetical protein IFR05_002275 [Cadophora sp. M221]
MDNTAETDATSSEKNLVIDPGPQPKPKAPKRTRTPTQSRSTKTTKKPSKIAKVPYHTRTSHGIHRVNVTELELSLIRTDYPWIKHLPFATSPKGCTKSIMILPEELDRLQTLRKSTKAAPLVKLKGHRNQKEWNEVVDASNERLRALLVKKARKAKKAAGQEDWVVFFGQMVKFEKV